MPRTTLDIDASVMSELRRRGEREGKSIGRVASEVLARGLQETQPVDPPFTWISANLGIPLVDLEDKEALNAVLDGRA